MQLTTVDKLVEEYCSKPWKVLRENKDPTWWTPLLPHRLANNSPIVILFRKSLVADCSPVHSWILRLLAGNQPLVALDSLTLLLSRAGGSSLEKKQRKLPKKIDASKAEEDSGTTTVEASDPSELITQDFSYEVDRSKSPANNESPLPTDYPKKVKRSKVAKEKQLAQLDRIFLRRFETNPSLKPEDKNQYFEIKDEPENFAPDIEYVVDVLEVLKDALLVAPTEKFQQTVSFLFYVISKPEGKIQRQILQRAMLRSINLLTYWLCVAKDRARECFLNEFKGTSDPVALVTGAFGKVYYYNSISIKARWLKDNWQIFKNDEAGEIEDEEEEEEEEEELETNEDFFRFYQKAVTAPHMMYRIGKFLFEKFHSLHSHFHFRSLVLFYVYLVPTSFNRFADLFRKMAEEYKDERIHHFLRAVQIILELE